MDDVHGPDLASPSARPRPQRGLRVARPSLGGLAAAIPDLALIGVLAALTVTFALIRVPFAIFEPQLDTVLLASGTMVSLAVAGLAYTRFREHGSREGLLEASGFLVLAIANLANLTVITTDADVALGFSLAQPGQLPLYLWAGARLVAAGLIAIGALRPREAPAGPRLPTLVRLWGPTALVLVVCAGLWSIRDRLPTLVDPVTLERLADETFTRAPLPGPNTGILVLDGLAVLLIALAALAYSRSDRGAAGIPRRYLVAGLIFAGFSGIHFILYPAVYTGLVTSADLLRISSFVILALGLQAGARRDLQDLRGANARLTFLAASEADRRAMSERARLARELHDGLAQDLWTAKLELDRLGQHLHASEATGETYARAARAVEAARREANDAVHALRAGFDAGTSLPDELPRRLDAFVERTGFAVDLELDPRVTLAGVVAAETLRIIDEALRNIEKHADATRIRVRLALDEGALRVSVDDNGRGYDPAEPASGHGVLGMKERASLLGGELNVRSEPGDGTQVELRLPLGERP